MRRWALALAVCLALASSVCLALAPSEARADDAEQARFHDEAARRHYAAGRYDEAIREFFLEQRSAPNPRVTFNLALCFDQLHREEDAFTHFDEYLASTDDDAERRGLAQAAIERLRPRVARVLVVTEPPGATIYVDDREHGAWGHAPRTLVLPAGPHTLLFELDGHEPAQAVVEAARGAEVRAAGVLARVLGALEVRAPSAGQAEVRDASGAVAAQGPTPLRADLAPGDYSVEVRVPEHRPWTSLARVVARAVAQLDAAPAPLPIPAGDLTVTSSAAGALIEVDGEEAGFAPAVLVALPAGPHEVRVSHPGLAPWAGPVTIEADARSWLTVSLEPPAQTVRSPLTWVLGGVGLAVLAGGGVLGGLSLDAHARFTRLEAAAHAGTPPTSSPLDARSQGLSYATAADVLFASGAALVVTALVLYFATESTERQASAASFAGGDR